MANGTQNVVNQNQERERLVVKSALRVVPLDKLNVDRSYQREEQKGLIGRIIRDMDPDALGVPLIAQREDHTLWVVDGQQRIAANRKLGKKSIRAEVFSSEGPEHEAKIFRLVNANRQSLSSTQLFRAALTEGDRTAWAIKECVESCGFKLVLGVTMTNRSKRTPKEVGCVSALRYLALRYGIESVRFALTVIDKSWQDDPRATDMAIVHGLGMFHGRHEGVVDIDKLAERLNKTTPVKLMYAAGLGNWSRSENMFEVLERMYKKRGPKKA